MLLSCKNIAKRLDMYPTLFSEFGAVWLQIRVDEIQVQQFCFTVDVYYCIAYYAQSPNKWSTTIYYVT
jgi:hypothetical protein